MISGFFAECLPCAAFTIISRACCRFFDLFDPIFPNWINASVKALRGGAVITDIGKASKVLEIVRVLRMLDKES